MYYSNRGTLSTSAFDSQIRANPFRHIACVGLCFLKLDAKSSAQKLPTNDSDSDSDDVAETVLPTPRGGGKSDRYLYSKEIQEDANKALELVRV